MHPDGSLNLAVVSRQAALLAANGVSGVFICGTTGECYSLTTAERMLVAEAWGRAIQDLDLRLMVHVGHNSLEEAKALATHAARIKADGIAAMSPSYFKPETVADLVGFCAPLAASAPDLPFYFYHIPSMTRVELSMPDFLRKAAQRIPNLAGIKYSSIDLIALQQCLQVEDGRFNLLFGVDELLLPALVLGVRGGVGSTYSYAAPLYRRLFAAFDAGDLATARALQFKAVKLVEHQGQFGVLASGKALMGMLAVDCGPVRPPLTNLTEAQIAVLHKQVAALGVLCEPVPA
jgi:N-acetylneuraminate lyase